MTIWIRIYPAIEFEDDDSSAARHNVNINGVAVLYMSVYRLENHAREAAKKYGGLVLPTTTDLLMNEIIEKDGSGFYLSGPDESDYISGEPSLPTSISVVVVANSYQLEIDDDEGDHAILSTEDEKWVKELERLTTMPMHI